MNDLSFFADQLNLFVQDSVSSSCPTAKFHAAVPHSLLYHVRDGDANHGAQNHSSAHHFVPDVHVVVILCGRDHVHYQGHDNLHAPSDGNQHGIVGHSHRGLQEQKAEQAKQLLQ